MANKLIDLLKFVIKLTLFFMALICMPIKCFAMDNNNIKVDIKTNDILSQFTEYAEKAQKDWKVPGMAIAVVKDDRIIYLKGFGKRDVKGDPVTPDTIFDIASLTKSFTAALLAMQIDQGKYDWNTKVITLYPPFKLYDKNAQQTFEVKDLAAHDSGLPENSTDALGDFGYRADDAINALQFIQPVAPFRKEFSYNSVFFEIAKKIIENNSKQNYNTYLHQVIFNPLDMKNSYEKSEIKNNTNINQAQEFLYYKGKNYPYSLSSPYISNQWGVDIGAAAGGIRSSAFDMAKWLIFNMNNGKLPNGKQRISIKNMNFIHSPQTIISRSANGDINQAYGEGWFIDKQMYKPYTVLYHAGGGTGMHALMAYTPEKKLGIVILTNQYTNKVPEALYKRLFDLYLNKKPLTDWSNLYLVQRKKAIELKETVKSIQCENGQFIDLKKYAGIYYNPVYGNVIITSQKNYLLLTIGPQKIIWQLTDCQNNKLKAYWPNPNGMNVPMLSDSMNTIEFTLNANNAINKMIIPYLQSDGSGVFVKTK